MKDRELVLSKEEISALDRRAIDGGIPSLTSSAAAATTAATAMRSRF